MVFEAYFKHFSSSFSDVTLHCEWIKDQDFYFTEVPPTLLTAPEMWSTLHQHLLNKWISEKKPTYIIPIAANMFLQKNV